LDKHFVGRSLEGLAADDGADGNDAFSARAQLFTDARHSKNRADTDERIAGTDDDAIGVADGFEDSGSSVRVLNACKVYAADPRLGAMLDEIFLKMKVAVAGFDDSRNGLVRHW